MSETLHRCDDKDAVIAYVYGEVDAEGRRAFEGHLRTCAACAREVEALQGVRADLASWLPPEPELGFTLVPKRDLPAAPAPVLQPPRWAFAAVPVWARAAAAVLVVGAGLGLANVQVRYGADGVTVTTGWLAAPQAPVAAAAVAAPVAGHDDQAAWRPELAALESTLRQEMATLRTGGEAVPAAHAASDDQAVLHRVQALIQDSEKRQQQELALRLRQFGSDVEMQRRADLVRFEQGFDRFQGRSGEALARQQRVLDLLVRASTTKVP